MRNGLTQSLEFCGLEVEAACLPAASPQTRFKKGTGTRSGLREAEELSCDQEMGWLSGLQLQGDDSGKALPGLGQPEDGQSHGEAGSG